MGFCDQINKELEGYGHIHPINPISAVTLNHAPCNVAHVCLHCGQHMELVMKPVVTQTLDCCCYWLCAWLFLSFIFFSPQISVRLLAHKIQSPQEWEAIQALTVCTVIISTLTSFSIKRLNDKIFISACFPFVGPRSLYEELWSEVSQWSWEI